MKKPQNWGQSCPNANCNDYGRNSQGNICSIASYLTQSGKRRIFRCKTCGTMFSETRDTVFYDLRTSEEKVMMALKMILVKVELSGISFVLGVKEETVLEWLKKASKKAKEINEALMKELSVTEVQLDEMWSYVLRKKSLLSVSDIESPDGAEDGRQWIWIGYAPVSRLILATVVGPRTYETALTLIKTIALVVSGIPCFFSDGFSCYFNALIEVYHKIKEFPLTGKRGRPKNPEKEPHPDLAYGQVIKKRSGRRIVGIIHRVMCGGKKIKELGLNISTTLLERLNLTFRQSLSPLVRKTLGFSKKVANLQMQTDFFQVFYNFARPHLSLRIPLEGSIKFDGCAEKKYSQLTPAMAAGITDHIWTFKELLTFRKAVIT
jgi:IS1 family transposase/transposase-like protein